MSTEIFDKNMLFFPWNYQGEMTLELLNMFADKDNYQCKKNELIRLNNDLKTLDISEYNLIYINIGAHSHDLNGVNRQIPPCITSVNRVLVILIDIFPNRPSIIDYFDFTNIEDSFYRSHNIDLRIYNTLFPTWLDANTVNLRYREWNKKVRIKQIKSCDKHFVEIFYNNLRSFIERASQMVYIVSTASYNENKYIGQIGNNNLELFPELLDMIGLNNFLLLIWVYDSIYFYVFGTMNKFNYMEDTIPYGLSNTSMRLGEFYKIETIKLKHYTEQK